MFDLRKIKFWRMGFLSSQFGTIWQRFSRRGALILGLVLLAAIFFYLAFSLLFISHSELKLAELKKSWLEEKICHEDCSRRRVEAAKEVVSALIAGERRTTQRLKKYFRDESLPVGFRRELVVLSRRAYGASNLPDYLGDYWQDPDGEPHLRAAILAAYDPAVLDKKFFFSGAPGQVALSPRDYYFHLLTDDDELLIKREAVRLISAQAEKGGTLSLNQLAIIRELMLDSVTPALLRPPLVLLLGDYYELFPVETVAVLKSVYVEGDEVSRAFAADILNKSGEKITAPAVSQEAWDEYYNN